MGNIFLENSYSKYGEETSPRLFFKWSKLSISLDQQSETLCSLFLLYFQVVVYWKILKLRCGPLALILHKAFLKTQEEVSLPHFSTSRKIFVMLYSVNWPNLNAWLSLLLEIRNTGWYFYRNCLLPSLCCHKFWNWPYLSYQTVFLHEIKSYGKSLNILRAKGAFQMK